VVGQPLSDAAQSFMGGNGATFLAIRASISMVGFCVGSGLATPRFLGVLAEDTSFPLARRSIPTSPLAPRDR
jgi:hypothetical protein